MELYVLLYVCYAVLQSILVIRYILKGTESYEPVIFMFVLFAILAPAVSVVVLLSGLYSILKVILNPNK